MHTCVTPYSGSSKNEHNQLKIEKGNSINNEIATINHYHKPRIPLSSDEIWFKEETKLITSALFLCKTAVFRKGL